MTPVLSDLAKAFQGAHVATPPKPTVTDTPDVEEKTALAIFHLDPDTAEKWLERNKANRSIRPQRVVQYAQDMASGNWRETGETIKFDTNGDLVDGQHRLQAVVQSGATVRIAVMFGLDPDVRHYVDTGAARTPSDALRMKGEASPAILGAAARNGILLERGVTNQRVSHAEVFAYIDANPDLRDAAVSVHSVLHKIDLAPSIIAYGFLRFRRVDFDAANDFFAKLANLNDLSSDDPILRLAHRMRQADRNKEKVGKEVQAVTLFRTWNSWRQGKTMARLILAPQDASLPTLV